MTSEGQFPKEGTLISAFAVLHCGERGSDKIVTCNESLISSDRTVNTSINFHDTLTFKLINHLDQHNEKEKSCTCTSSPQNNKNNKKQPQYPQNIPLCCRAFWIQLQEHLCQAAAFSLLEHLLGILISFVLSEKQSSDFPCSGWKLAWSPLLCLNWMMLQTECFLLRSFLLCDFRLKDCLGKKMVVF